MANREQKSSREKRKPKAEKPKSTGKASPFSGTAAMASAKGGAGKKGR